MNKSMGCFSASAAIAGIITALIIAAAVIISGGSMFSPGGLNAVSGNQLGGVQSHAQMSTECGKCHTPFWSSERMADRCMACHADVAEQLSDSRSLHGLLREGHPAMNCKDCHPDHRGASASLTSYNASFPHDRFGYSLASHPSTSCKDCHAGNYKGFDTANCTNCHQSLDAAFMTAHRLAYGTGCMGCHDGIETVGKNFDHAKTQFPLTGLHANVLCTQCHLDNQNLKDMKNTPTQCADCHSKDDPHNGKFGSACDTCHSTNGWKPAKFDHNLATFKLTGKHNSVACENCHTQGLLGSTPSTCGECHQKDDAHHGQLGSDCGSCHTTDGWKPSTFDHNNSMFKLTGAHINLSCGQCHQNGDFKGTPTVCGTCHAKDDKHNGGFGTDCGLCHSTTAWKPATFDHNLSAFKLTGAHAGLSCLSCHSKGFIGTPTACAACHADPTYHRGLFGANCASCHNTSNWNATYTGPHPSFGEGGGIHHGGASCRDCHPTSLASATCLKCHNSNNPGDGGGGGG